MTEPLTMKGYLVVRADGSVRVTKSRVRWGLDEVAFPLTVSISTTWRRVQNTTIDIALPEPPEARVSIGPEELDET